MGLVGPRTRRSGAARTSRWVALRPHPSLTIVTQAIPTGRLGGAMTRRAGAAPTRRRAARSELAEATGSLRSAVLRPCASQVQDGERICFRGVVRVFAARTKRHAFYLHGH